MAVKGEPEPRKVLGTVELKPDIYQLVQREFDSPTIAVDRILREYYGLSEPTRYKEIVVAEMKKRKMSRVIFTQRNPTQAEVDEIYAAVRATGLFVSRKKVKQAMKP